MSQWKKVRIGDIFAIEKGSLQSSKNTDGEYDFITAAADWKTHNSYDHDCEAIVYAVAASGSLGRAHYVNGKFIASDLCFILTEKDKNKYPINFLFYQIVFEMLRDEIVSKTKTGTSKESINRGNFSNYEIPYFSIEFQLANYQRFVDAKNQIQSLNEESEKQKKYLKQLRQNILQEAIEGKLTTAWRKSHPVIKGNPDYDAEALFEKIQKEKDSDKKQKQLPQITDEEKTFEIPEGWKWIHLNQIADIGTGATPLTSETKYYKDGTIPWITSSATSNDFIANSDTYITQFALNETNCSINPIGTLIVAMYGQGKTRGQISELRIEAATNQACATIQLYDTDDIFLRKYVKLVFKKMYDEIRSLAQGGAQPNLNLTKISNTLFPLPPKKEQEEIVNKIESLLAKLTKLENQTQKRKTLSEKLVFGIIKEKLEE